MELILICSLAENWSISYLLWTDLDQFSAMELIDIAELVNQIFAMELILIR